MTGYIRIYCILWSDNDSSLKALDKQTLLKENAFRREPYLLVIGERVPSCSGQSRFLKIIIEGALMGDSC